MEEGKGTVIPTNANEHCPGTESDQAGKSSACEGCPNQNVCETSSKAPDVGSFFYFYNLFYFCFFFLLKINFLN